MASLHPDLLSLERDQSGLEGAVLLIGETLAELEQSITRLERCPQEVALPWRTAFSNNGGSWWSQQGNLFADRNRLYRALLEVNARMTDPDRDWPPDADVIKQQMCEHRRRYEEHCPVIGVLACHVETLAAIQKQLDAINDRLTVNGKLFREIGLHGDRWLGDFCCNLLENCKEGN
ncbi:uncharacterized protein LOC110681187 [Aedes aegypti]|uniref:Uncharacterized protein n=1 Tax=Aedes aegypti TaxID=7159 RepID=A0A6I8U7E6_AEDAE|nr:uncharacterized protein LOC110679440 [Aedes aegypti]XP_021712656.1 uncharacterized protein LOC110681187 [Aedes aegypti]